MTTNTNDAIRKIRELARVALDLADQMEAALAPIRSTSYGDGYTINQLHFPHVDFFHYPARALSPNAFIVVFDEMTRERVTIDSSLDSDEYNALWSNADWNVEECKRFIEAMNSWDDDEFDEISIDGDDLDDDIEDDDDPASWHDPIQPFIW